MTTLTALTHPRLRFAAGPPWRAFVLGFGLTMLLAALVGLGASGAMAVTHDGRIMPNVSIAGIQVGNLTRDEAAERLSAGLPGLGRQSVTVRVGDDTERVALDELTSGYDIDGMLSEAFGVARSGNPLTDGVARLRSLAQPTAVASRLSPVQGGALDAAVSALVSRFDVAASDARVTRHGTAFDVTPAVVGRVLDPAAVRSALLAAPLGDGTTTTVSLAATTIEPMISTAQAEQAAQQAEWITSAPLWLYGRDDSSATLSAGQLASLISFAAGDNGYAASVDADGVRALIDPLRRDYARKPHNAAYTWDSSGISGVVPAVVGRRLDVEGSAANAMEAIQARAAGSFTMSAGLVISARQPALTTKAATAAARQMRVLGTWTTWYAPGEGNYWGANISIPANDLDRMVIAPGEWFSFWNDIGPVTLARGYGYGGVIIGGRSVANGALAGGICSTSTTLFNAAMRSGLEIGDRANHSYYIERYPVGLDATVLKTDSWAQDMTFRNDTKHPIIIRSYTATGMVRFDIWGVPDGRTVSLTTPVKRNYHTAHWSTVTNPDLKPGTIIYREYPHDGFDTSVTRTVRGADGTVIHQDTWFSHYNTVTGIMEVGPKRGGDGGGNA